jgi:hypothetical protein
MPSEKVELELEVTGQQAALLGVKGKKTPPCALAGRTQGRSLTDKVHRNKTGAI